MSHTALIRFAPVTCTERITDPRWQRPRTMYDPGALKMLPGKTSIPLIVNHDNDRVVGLVRSFSRMEDAGGPWHVAHATIDHCPGWLRNRDTKASFGFKVLFENTDVFGCEIVRDAFVTEISLLSPDRRPKEPLARVVGLWEAEARDTRPIARIHATSVPDHASMPRDADDWSAKRAIDEWIASTPPGMIRRPGIGQVLGVR